MSLTPPPLPEKAFEPLLALGFTGEQCLAAVEAIRRTKPPLTDHDIVNYLYEDESSDLSMHSFPPALSPEPQQSTKIWGDPVEAPSSAHDLSWEPRQVSANFSLCPTSDGRSASCSIDLSLLPKNASQPPVEVSFGSSSSALSSDNEVAANELAAKVNGFVFHCNSRTRHECLERRLFGCPSGGRYGPHSSAKKGDIVFLADFSKFTVTGMFVAESDAGMNLEPDAFGGRYPWQIRVRPITATGSLRKSVHIDVVNKILGLAPGSKLNFLSKPQLKAILLSEVFTSQVPHILNNMAEPPSRNELPGSISIPRTMHSFVECASQVPAATCQSRRSQQARSSRIRC